MEPLRWIFGVRLTGKEGDVVCLVVLNRVAFVMVCAAGCCGEGALCGMSVLSCFLIGWVVRNSGRMMCCYLPALQFVVFSNSLVVRRSPCLS